MAVITGLAGGRRLVRDYGQELRLFRGTGRKVAVLAAVAIYLWLPTILDDEWAGILVLVGITTIGALGLNLLTGYAGQPSLGSAAFIGIGAFTAGYLGGRTDIFGNPDPGWSFFGYFAVAAEVVGVSLFRYKIAAFVLSSALISMAGVLYGIYLQYLTPNESSLGLSTSIQYLAIVIIGGIGTTYGPVLGALLVGVIP